MERLQRNRWRVVITVGSVGVGDSKHNYIRAINKNSFTAIKNNLLWLTFSLLFRGIFGYSNIPSTTLRAGLGIVQGCIFYTYRVKVNLKFHFDTPCKIKNSGQNPVTMCKKISQPMGIYLSNIKKIVQNSPTEGASGKTCSGSIRSILNC